MLAYMPYMDPMGNDIDPTLRVIRRLVFGQTSAPDFLRQVALQSNEERFRAVIGGPSWDP